MSLKKLDYKPWVVNGTLDSQWISKPIVPLPARISADPEFFGWIQLALLFSFWKRQKSFRYQPPFVQLMPSLWGKT